MKLKSLLVGDMKFQWKYGFYFVYAVFTFIYTLILILIPKSWVDSIGIIVIFSDPSALGLIFMGAIIHLDLSERTFDSMIISPIKPSHYLISKLLSIGLISLIVGLIIGIIAQVINNYLSFIIGIFLGSAIFSTIGLIIAFKTKSLNQFALCLAPAMALLILPGGIYLFGWQSIWFIIHPGIALIEMLLANHILLAFLVLIFWFIIVYLIAYRILKKHFNVIRGHGI